MSDRTVTQAHAGSHQVLVDTHTHIVSPDTEPYPLTPASNIPNDWVADHRLTADKLLAHMDAAGVHGAVLIQARGAYGYDNSYVCDARLTAPDRFVTTAIVDMTTPARSDALQDWVARGAQGLRLFNIPRAEPSWLADPALPAFVADAAGQGIRISVCTLADDLPDVERLLRAVPDVPIALDHCGFADITGDFSHNDAGPLVPLAECDNVRLKVTTTLLHTATDRGHDARDLVDWLASRFTADRLMWGSDFPQYHAESYGDIVAFGRRACSRLSPSDQAKFFGGTALLLWPELSPNAE